VTHQQKHTDYLPGLEGLRAFAVVAVILYHLDIPGLFSSGFLGVDIFFTVSGFLITAQLIRQFQKNGTIAIGNFYLKRARRLFPAVLALLIFCVLVTEWFVQDAAWRTRSDLLPTLFYFSNWWQIFSEQSYFEMSGRPALLQHLWSLAIEEQFYIAWPLLLLVILRHFRERGVLFVAAGLALLSSGWMIYLSARYGYPQSQDPSRIYLGTDTHTMGLFLGASLAADWNPWQTPATHETPGTQLTRAMTDFLGLICLSALLWAMLFVTEYDRALYQGGFFWVGLFSIGLVFAAAQKDSALSELMSIRPLAWLGKRSYGLYLWHWPVFALLRPEFELSDNAWIQASIRLTLTLLLTELSYQLIENPVRTGEVFQWPAQKRYGFFAACFVGILSTVLTIQIRPAPVEKNNALASQVADELSQAEDPPHDSETPAHRMRAACIRSVSNKFSIKSKPVITVLGDSVLLGASDHLAKRVEGLEIDAAIGRQGKDGLNRLHELKERNELADIVVIHLGTNGYLYEAQVREVMALLSTVRQVVFVNVKAPRRWEKSNNDLLKSLSADFPNVKLIDWRAIGQSHKEYFGKDHIHLTKKGVRAMTAEILRVSGLPAPANNEINKNLKVVPCSMSVKS
jgi:peptidoglycan/LPS O-acetylase OafA/YrhL